MVEVSAERAARALAVLGLPATGDMMAQMAIFARALEVYDQRELTYGGAWKEAPLVEFRQDIDKKNRRISSALTGLSSDAPIGAERETMFHESIEDSAVDIINYAGFIVRRVGEDRA